MITQGSLDAVEPMFKDRDIEAECPKSGAVLDWVEREKAALDPPAR